MSDMILQTATELAKNIGVLGTPEELITTLKNTVFKGNATDSQLEALLFVATQHKLNPFTREIYAFPDRNNGIVPVVGVDGWSRIINSHPQFDGMDFDDDDASCTCVIYRKDRAHPIKVTEYLAECKRENVQPWKSHPKRMLRHKAMIQCARLAFGFSGIYEPDEAAQIVENQNHPKDMGNVIEAEPNFYPQADFDNFLPQWLGLIESGKKTAEQIIAIASSKGKLTKQQQEQLFGVVA